MGVAPMIGNVNSNHSIHTHANATLALLPFAMLPYFWPDHVPYITIGFQHHPANMINCF